MDSMENMDNTHSNYQNTVIDFDLNYFRQGSNSLVPNKLDKQKKAILIAKKKTIATDSLIRKFYEKRQLLEQIEKSLIAAKEECKRVCIEYNNALGKCSLLEIKIQTLEQNHVENERKLVSSENNFAALQSHVNQLQQLVRENETVIESLKIENQLEKSNAKKNDRNISNLQNANDVLSKHLRWAISAIFDKKKLKAHQKELLQKYTNNNLNGDLFCADHSDHESLMVENVLSDNEDEVPLDKELDEDIKKLQLNKNNDDLGKKIETGKDDIDHDSDCNEIVSVDTGRASSLASTDSLHSPDYYTEDNSISIDITKDNNNKIQTTSVATSPLTITVVCNSSTSPIMFEECHIIEKTSIKDAAISPIIFDCTKTKNTYVDKGTSTTTVNLTDVLNDVNKIISDKYCTTTDNNRMELTTAESENIVLENRKKTVKNVAISPVIFNDIEGSKSDKNCMNTDNNKMELTRDESENMVLENRKKTVKNVALSPVIFNSTNTLNVLFDNTISPTIINSAHTPNGCEENKSEQTCREKECLELNNSKNMLSDSGSDSEIQMILESMRITHKLITPLPRTPLKSISGNVSVNSKLPNIEIDHKKGCQEAAKIREENKVLHSSIAELAKEIHGIKTLLTNSLLLKGHISEYNNGSNISNNTVEQFKPCDNFDQINTKEDVIQHKDPVSDNRKLFNNTDELIEIKNKLNNTTRKKKAILPYKPSACEDTQVTNSTADRFESEHIADQPRQEENGLQYNDSMSVELQPNILRPDSDSELHRTLNDIDISNDSDTALIDLSLKNKTEIRPKKLSKLAKLRKTLIPRSKIKRAEVHLHKRKLIKKKPATIGVKKVFNRVKESDNSATLNERNVYEKALKVMNELKTTQKLNVRNVTINITKSIELEEMIKKATNSKKNVYQSTLSPIQTKNVITRSQRKSISEKDLHCKNNKEQNAESKSPSKSNVQDKNNRKRRIETCLDQSENFNKRMLRSSTHQTSDESLIISNDHDPNISTSKLKVQSEINKVTVVNDKNVDEVKMPNNTLKLSPRKNNKSETMRDKIAYNNLDMFLETKSTNDCNEDIKHLKESIFCTMLEKHAIVHLKRFTRKGSNSTISNISKLIDERISEITVLPPAEAKNAMDKFVVNVKAMNTKQFLLGLMDYLKSPDRKNELFNKVIIPAAPTLTKSEQVLLYVVSQIKCTRPDMDILNNILKNIEYTLFKLNGTPDFNTIETMSHFYAVLCRYFRQKSRLRLFMLDALYCIQFKAIPLIKQCLEVWMHVLPLAHMGIAKSPLVICLVYLLNFYKCDDSRNRVQDIKYILGRKYSYEISDWNETKILDTLKSSILELKYNSLEAKSLRMALIIIAKRSGPRWCQNKIIKKLLLPLIEKNDVPERVKRFCVSALGPLMKPYPHDMRVHCEIVMNQLIDMLTQNPSPLIQEAIFTSLLYMSRHNYYRVIKALLTWKPNKITPEFEELMRIFIREKPAKSWKTLLSKIHQFNS